MTKAYFYIKLHHNFKYHNFLIAHLTELSNVYELFYIDSFNRLSKQNEEQFQIFKSGVTGEAYSRRGG